MQDLADEDDDNDEDYEDNEDEEDDDDEDDGEDEDQPRHGQRVGIEIGTITRILGEQIVRYTKLNSPPLTAHSTSLAMRSLYISLLTTACTKRETR